jgi:hypothetical protein
LNNSENYDFNYFIEKGSAPVRGLSCTFIIFT